MKWLALGLLLLAPQAPSLAPVPLATAALGAAPDPGDRVHPSLLYELHAALDEDVKTRGSAASLAATALTSLPRGTPVVVIARDATARPPAVLVRVASGPHVGRELWIYAAAAGK